MKRRETTFLGPGRQFPQTSWSLIRLGRDPASPAYHASLETLYRRYWGPVYFYIRRNWSKEIEEAKDLTQTFFVAFLEKDFLQSVDSDKGRFRSFVCGALKNFLANEHRAANAKKRSPEGGLVSIDALGFDENAYQVADSRQDPDLLLAADWKRSILRRALDELRRRGQEAKKEHAVRAFERYDLERVEGEKLKYEDLAAELGLTVYQVTNGLHWARKEFKAICLEELSEEVASEEDLRTEAWELLGIRL